jgi:hypothetical protein
LLWLSREPRRVEYPLCRRPCCLRLAAERPLKTVYFKDARTGASMALRNVAIAGQSVIVHYGHGD